MYIIITFFIEYIFKKKLYYVGTEYISLCTLIMYVIIIYIQIFMKHCSYIFLISFEVI